MLSSSRWIVSRWLLTVSLSAAWLGCDTDTEEKQCATIARASLTVTVLDRDGKRICDAEVTATDGSFSQKLEPLGPPESCTYAGPFEREGTYRVFAKKDGLEPNARENLVVTKGECNVNGLVVEITLNPL